MNFFYLFTINCIEKTKINKKRLGMAHLFIHWMRTIPLQNQFEILFPAIFGRSYFSYLMNQKRQKAFYFILVPLCLSLLSQKFNFTKNWSFCSFCCCCCRRCRCSSNSDFFSLNKCHILLFHWQTPPVNRKFIFEA